MTDCAAPIIVDGHHVANVFIGQFHLKKPDLIFFRKQAAEFGFDADKYVAAVEEAPVMDEAKLPHILGYLARFARLIGSFAVEQRRAVLADEASAARGEELRRERIAAVSLAEDAEKARSKLADYQAGLEKLVADRTQELEKTATEVRESEKRLRGILETSPVSIAFSTKGIIHFANSLFVDTFGAKVGEPSPQLYVNLADRDDLIGRLKAEGVAKNYELKMYDREQRERDMLVTYLPINYDGEDGILGWLLDITERKQAEGELRERLEELERFGRLTVDREEKMIQLKEEINSLLEQTGKEAKYKIVV
jgi:PAS domain S-box-containing protein